MNEIVNKFLLARDNTILMVPLSYLSNFWRTTLEMS